MEDNQVAAGAEQTEGTTGSIGSMITEKLLESIKNMDIATVLKKIVESKPSDEQSEIAQKKIQDVLLKYNSMDEEERGIFTDQIKNALASKMMLKMQDRLSGLEETIHEAIMDRVLFVGVCFLVLFVIVVFFGYKLYKSIKDKQLKREEKKKSKQMKKKK